MDLVLFLLIIIIPAIAHIGIKRSYSQYRIVESKKKLSGQEVARKILDHNDLKNVHIVETPGELTDHYDPRRKTVRLSKEIFHNDSIASLSIAAHEVGHALQDKDNYIYLKIRSLIFPVVRIATSISYFIIMIGIIAQALDVVMFGIALTAFGLIFQLVTLPVEINASKRAIEELINLNIIYEEETNGVKKVLKSAALTYVAGVLASILQIVRLLLIFGRED